MAEIALGFRNLTVTSNGTDLLSGVSGYVDRGCITAVLGASAAGKSVLLQTLSGRIQNLEISGDVYMDGSEVDPKALGNPVAYVPQEDSLIGDLTAREVATNTALFKRNDAREKIDADVSDLLDRLGLTKVADGIIGTLIFRGLSGGQKKRAEIATELIAAPSILLLDEPTSGLDSKVAYDVLSTIRNIVKASNGMISVMLVIHQPNDKILSLFDHIMFLENGNTTFFGTLPQSLAHFSGLGFPCPSSVTPTDYFLQITDKNFSTSDCDFRESYQASEPWKVVDGQLADYKRKSTMHTEKSLQDLQVKKDYNANKVTFWKQVYVLVYREYTLAYRDPTLYYFQLTMLLTFAFLSGAVFWMLPQEINGNFLLFPAGLLWIVFCYVWVHAFKVYYLSSGNRRVKHEVANAKYPISAVLVADTIATATLGCMFFPIAPVTYFMMGFPQRAFPYLILACWVTFIAAEAMIALVTKLSTSPTTSMVYAMISLVTLQIFGGGVFIAWNDCPDYWIWLQEITVFAQASRTLNMEVFAEMLFTCSTLENGFCIEPGTGNKYRCQSYNAAGDECEVDGREVLFVTQGVPIDKSFWDVFGYLVAILFCLKFGIALFTYFPVEEILYKFSTFISKHVLPQRTVAKPVQYNKMLTAISPSIGSARQATTPAIEGAKPSLSWTDFSVILPSSGAKLVDDVGGYVKSGRILALMGPSGAGKTTLLNGLADRAPYANLVGKVSFAGREMTSQDLTYVPQFDEVNDVLTVWEHIALVGRLTCVDEAAMLTRAEELLSVLGLMTKRDLQVRNLSGGEIKRLSIGVGLISNPNVLFLDEPTTGLDSTAAYSIVNYLSIVTKAFNVAVIMTIHQPSALVFSLLDDLLLLESGHVVYGGEIAEAKSYFSSVGCDNPMQINPADYYLDLVQSAPPKGDKWHELFSQSQHGVTYRAQLQEAQTTIADKQPQPLPSIMSRLYTMTKHFVFFFLAEPGYFIYRLYALILIAVFEGTLFLNLDTETSQINAYAGAMFSTAVAVMLTVVASTALFARDRREAVDRVANGFYSPGVYVTAQFIASSFFNLLIVFVFSSIFHWLVDLNPNGEAFLYDILISWGHLLLMEAAIMNFVEILKNDFLCTTMGMIFIGSNMLFSGFFRQQKLMPDAISWLCYVVPLHWSFNGFIWMIFRDQNFVVTGSDPVTKISGMDVLNDVFGLNNVNPWGMFATLLAYVVFFRLCQYFLFAVQTGKICKAEFKALSRKYNNLVSDVFSMMDKQPKPDEVAPVKEDQIEKVA